MRLKPRRNVAPDKHAGRAVCRWWLYVNPGRSETIVKRGGGSFRTESSAKEYLFIIQLLASMITHL
jgi:hypothetical protein